MTRKETIRKSLVDSLGCDIDTTAEAILEALDTLEGLVECRQCHGTGTETLYVSDPECGNCQHGDCDYGHAKLIPCFQCKSTGRV